MQGKYVEAGAARLFSYREDALMALTKKQIADYEQFYRDRNSGRILTPDSLRFIYEAYNYDAEAIGKHFLELLQRFAHTERILKSL